MYFLEDKNSEKHLISIHYENLHKFPIPFFAFQKNLLTFALQFPKPCGYATLLRILETGFGFVYFIELPQDEVYEATSERFAVRSLGNEMLWILFFWFNVKIGFCGFQ